MAYLPLVAQAGGTGYTGAGTAAGIDVSARPRPAFLPALNTGVLADAFTVRRTVIPAVMALLGRAAMCGIPLCPAPGAHV